MIPQRTLTRSGLALTEIGLGCATLAFDAAPDAIADARRMLEDTKAAGIQYFDTAPHYGQGLSERLTGDTLRGVDGHVLSSKVGRLLRPDADAQSDMPFKTVYDYSYDGIMRSVEDSYQRLGLSKIDILYAHDLGEQTHGPDAPARFAEFIDNGGYRAMDELRSSGDVQAIGLGVNEVAVCQQALDHGEFDVFLLAGRHTLLERNDATSLLKACEAAKTDIVIGGPFNSGMLVGGTTYNYRDIPAEMAARRAGLLEYCAAHRVEIGAAALQFPLRQSVVKSVIPGPKNPVELKQILQWHTAQIPDAFWEGLDDLPH